MSIHSTTVLSRGYQPYLDDEEAEVKEVFVEQVSNCGGDYLCFTKEDLLKMLKILEEGE